MKALGKRALSLHKKFTAPAKFHEPVLVDKVVSFLVGNRNGIYVDATLGGGGHAKAFLANLNASARVVGIDADSDAIASAKSRLGKDPRIHIARNRFSAIKNVLHDFDISGCCGILADLGISSHQIDTPARGFGFMADGPLDMRMDAQKGEPASALLARLEEKELAAMIRQYGEEKFAYKIARKIKFEQNKNPEWTTRRLAAIIESVVPAKFSIKSVARVFQALRIVVNDELGELSRFLPEAFQLLNPNGRLVVISYHSLEDRRVKQFFAEKIKECICPPEAPICTCGHQPEGHLLNKKAITPDKEEVKRNSRARSAKLRAIEKI